MFQAIREVDFDLGHVALDIATDEGLTDLEWEMDKVLKKEFPGRAVKKREYIRR